jgi:hypothetical protein
MLVKEMFHYEDQMCKYIENCLSCEYRNSMVEGLYCGG